VLVVGSFVAAVSGILFLILRERGQLRVTAEEEMLGMDIAEHATPAYNDDVVAMEAYLGGGALITADAADLSFDDDWLDA